MYTFEDICEAAKISTDEDRNEKGDASKRFKRFLARISVNPECFKNEKNRYCFNEDGKKFAVALLTGYGEKPLYKSIRRNEFLPERELYAEMIEQICSNYRDICLEKGYSDQCINILIQEQKRRFWRPIIMNSSLDILPGISHLGKLPDILNDEFQMIIDDVIYMEDLLWQDILCLQTKWIVIMYNTLLYRKKEWENIVKNSPETVNLVKDTVNWVKENYPEKTENRLAKEKTWYKNYLKMQKAFMEESENLMNREDIEEMTVRVPSDLLVDVYIKLYEYRRNKKKNV